MCTRVLSLVLAGALVGCSAVPGPSDLVDSGAIAVADAGVDAGIPPSRICEDTAEAYFARLVRCGELTEALAALYKPPFVAECPTLIPPGVADGRIVLEAAEVQACLSRAASASCLVEPPSCNILRGVVSAGGACFESDECEAAFSCDTSAACPGTCVARVAIGTRPTASQECVKSAFLHDGVCTAFSTGSCAGGLTCADPLVCSVSDVCVTAPPLRAVNERCSLVDQCGKGLQCVSDVCVARVAENGACGATRRCKDGLRCSSANVCVVVNYGGAGASCAEAGDGCRPGFFCDSGTCAALRTSGGACTDTGAECSPELYCEANVCKAPAVVDQPCVLGGPPMQCADGLYCDASGRCAQRKPANAQCIESEECLGFCQGLRCTVPPCRDLTP
ncbi:MAG: hypothetical protein Q8K32_32240 [Archangium sp.]|nr:hypothetical protein [Archangium sp.]